VKPQHTDHGMSLEEAKAAGCHVEAFALRNSSLRVRHSSVPPMVQTT
jgi:hypothetical protein